MKLCKKRIWQPKWDASFKKKLHKLSEILIFLKGKVREMSNFDIWNSNLTFLELSLCSSTNGYNKLHPKKTAAYWFFLKNTYTIIKIISTVMCGKKLYPCSNTTESNELLFNRPLQKYHRWNLSVLHVVIYMHCTRENEQLMLFNCAQWIYWGINYFCCKTWQTKNNKWTGGETTQTTKTDEKKIHSYFPMTFQ